MDRDQLVEALAKRLPHQLAADLVDEFLQMRRDLASDTFGRSSPGKFVEALAQSLQYLDTGSYQPKPDVDAYLRGLDSTVASIPEGLKLIAARIGRSMYTVRNKRSIAHKGELDPNRSDLKFLVAGGQWVLAELIRVISALPVQEAAKLVEQVSTPVGGLVQDFGDRRLVLAHTTIPEEILLLLHSFHPGPATLEEIRRSMDRRSPSKVQAATRELWRKRLLHGSAKDGYRLTDAGFQAALAIIHSHMSGA